MPRALMWALQAVQYQYVGGTIFSLAHLRWKAALQRSHMTLAAPWPVKGVLHVVQGADSNNI